MNKRYAVLIAVIVVLFIGVNATFFTVGEADQAVVTALGKPVRVIQEPGLYLKIPFIQQVALFDRRLLEYDASPRAIITKDKKTLRVDNYAKWRIVDPLLFLQTVRTEAGAQARLDDIIYSELRVDLARKDLIQIVATDRAELMEVVRVRTDEKARALGIEITDVRIKRADLPEQNEAAVFGRMKAERERIARQFRSEGKEEALKIRSNTDRERTIMLADAYEKDQTIRGEGDADSVRVYAEAFERDPEFFDFVRTLEAYRKSLDNKTTILLPPQSEFLHHLNMSEIE